MIPKSKSFKPQRKRVSEPLPKERLTIDEVAAAVKLWEQFKAVGELPTQADKTLVKRWLNENPHKYPAFIFNGDIVIYAINETAAREKLERIVKNKR